MHIQARLRIAFDPAVPRHARRLVTTCRHIFDHFRLDGKAGGRETETRTRRQMRAAAVVKADVGSVAVIARPRIGILADDDRLLAYAKRGRPVRADRCLAKDTPSHAISNDPSP